ncbi:agmatine N(4)-coumaroyltransferase [Trifolium repens]|nr:agmatine N(4)-coumaroyltransferase [Trifolium repens]
MSEALETLKVGVLNGAEDWCSGLVEGVATADVKTVGAAGSPKFEVYSTDFGCGKPKKVEIASIDRTGAFCISDCRNGDGVEMVLCLRKEQWRHLLLSLQMSLHLKAFIWLWFSIQGDIMLDYWKKSFQDNDSNMKNSPILKYFPLVIGTFGANILLQVCYIW